MHQQKMLQKPAHHCTIIAPNRCVLVQKFSILHFPSPPFGHGFSIPVFLDYLSNQVRYHGYLARYTHAYRCAHIGDSDSDKFSPVGKNNNIALNSSDIFPLYSAIHLSSCKCVIKSVSILQIIIKAQLHSLQNMSFIFFHIWGNSFNSLVRQTVS